MVTSKKEILKSGRFERDFVCYYDWPYKRSPMSDFCLETQAFTDPCRVRNDELCNLRHYGELGENESFELHQLRNVVIVEGLGKTQSKAILRQFSIGARMRLEQSNDREIKRIIQQHLSSQIDKLPDLESLSCELDVPLSVPIPEPAIEDNHFHLAFCQAWPNDEPHIIPVGASFRWTIKLDGDLFSLLKDLPERARISWQVAMMGVRQINL